MVHRDVQWPQWGLVVFHETGVMRALVAVGMSKSARRAMFCEAQKRMWATGIVTRA